PGPSSACNCCESSSGSSDSAASSFSLSTSASQFSAVSALTLLASASTLTTWFSAAMTNCASSTVGLTISTSLRSIDVNPLAINRTVYLPGFTASIAYLPLASAPAHWSTPGPHSCTSAVYRQRVHIDRAQ